LKIAVDLEGSNGPGLALEPQKSMVFGLIVTKKSKLPQELLKPQIGILD
jgi:hypothetical protein